MRVLAALALVLVALLLVGPAYRVSYLPDNAGRVSLAELTRMGREAHRIPALIKRRISGHPLVAEVRVERRGLLAVEVRVRERRPLALWEDALGVPGVRKLGLVLDADGHPLPLAEAPIRLKGRGSHLDEALAIARAQPRARTITFGPAGFVIDFGQGRYWTGTHRLPAAFAPDQRGSVHLYTWGVSVRK